MSDIVTFGSATVDIFIENDDANVVTIKSPTMQTVIPIILYSFL